MKVADLKEDGWYWYIPSTNESELVEEASPISYYKGWISFNESAGVHRSTTVINSFEGDFYPLNSDLFTKPSMDSEILKYAQSFYFGRAELERGIIVDIYIQRKQVNDRSGWFVLGQSQSNIVRIAGQNHKMFYLTVDQKMKPAGVYWTPVTSSFFMDIHMAVAALGAWMNGRSFSV